MWGGVPFDFDVTPGRSEVTPKLYRKDEKEPNQIVKTDTKWYCYICARLTEFMVVFVPYPKVKNTDREVKPYRVFCCPGCAIAHKLVPKPES